MFARYHYLSHYHLKSAKVYILTVNEEIAAFCSVAHFPHPKVRDIKRIHRLVVKPDFQGAGFGKYLLDWIGERYTKDGYRLRIVTTSPAIKQQCNRSKEWCLMRQSRVSGRGTKGKGSHSVERITTTWQYVIS